MCVNSVSVLNYYLILAWKFYEKHIKWVLNATVNEVHPSSLKNTTCYWSVDCYDPDAGGQATFYSSHEITALIWLVCFSEGLSTLDATKKKE